MGFFSAAFVSAAVWSIRFTYDPTETIRDLKWVTGCIVWTYKRHLRDFMVAGSQYVIEQGFSYRSLLLGLLFDFLSACAIYWYYEGQWRESQHLVHGQVGLPRTTNPLKPLVFPCRTTHTRFFPKKHSFSYSYLFVGIPISWRGSIGSFLSADIKSLPCEYPPRKRGWLSVESADYLNRGEDVHGLQGKLDSYLRSQNEDPQYYAYSYLITAPRFLGYSFNPVSFWYLYDGERKLKAMILEVNNTFDERRMYFLKDSGIEAIDNGNGENHITSAKFANTWTKDFHVSPFNSRKGSYSLAALDPFSAYLNNKGPVDNTITLSSSKAHSKLVARIFSTSTSLDPSSLTKLGILRFLASWWWVGLVTFPRIVREAGKLFFKRKLHVWFRPEVLKDSIGRIETPEERAIALVFRDFLKSQVEHSDLPLPVKYVPAIPSDHGEEVFTSNTLVPESTSPLETLLFKPTTPLFYANLARSPKISSFIASSLRNPDIKTHTFYTSHPCLLATIFLRPQQRNPATLSLIDRLYLALISALRKGPQNAKPSPLDGFAVQLRTSNKAMVRSFRRSTLKILLSDRVAFGLVPVVDGLTTTFRLWLCWLCAQAIMSLMRVESLSDQTAAVDIGKLAVGSMGIHLWCWLGQLL
ncbi:hypothetical protein N7G274_001988 [Stereocaulon virgatum]|uniref:DUF1365-domain-containing protein n=1 Tax=Stereocaulon virgatum TaxID=373712 RepID=A0ABR4AIH5_9LECA